MPVKPFHYVAPDSVDELLGLLADLASKGDPAQVMAGGTDLLVQMKTALKAPQQIIDIKAVPEATEVKITGRKIYIGAAVSAAKLNINADLCRLLPGLMEAAYLIGSSQIQSRASIGGNLSNASPAGDTIPALIALDARCDIKSAKADRQVKVEDFLVDAGRNCLEPGECLLGLEIDLPEAPAADAYMRFIPRTEMDIAVAGVGCHTTLDRQGVCTAARIGLGAVAKTALCAERAADALVGSKLDEPALQLAAELAVEAATPISDKRGTADFRRKLVAVLTRRVASTAYQRAKALI